MSTSGGYENTYEYTDGEGVVRTAEGHGGGYENAPATRMLATFCACCRRPLVDATSVEVGVGPDCRRKYGFNRDVDETARKEANQLVYQIALEGDGLRVATACVRLRELGFNQLATVVEKRACPVRIAAEGELLAVHTPYSDVATDAFRRVPGRRWHPRTCSCGRCRAGGEPKVNTFPATSRRELLAALERAFPGVVACGPKGPFVIGDRQLAGR